MRVVAGVGLVIVTLMAVGCGASKGDSGEAAKSVNSLGLETSPPESYHPCADVPQGVLGSERLRGTGQADADAPDGVRWRGCKWVKNNGYSVSIRMTNMTLPFVRKTFYTMGREATVGGRSATIAHRSEARGPEVCTVNVEIKGGSLEFDVDNPRSSLLTGELDTCELGLALAEKVVPTLPAGA